MKIATEELRKPLRIYTEQTSDVGGLWAFEPYAMFHVEFVEAGDYIAERNRSEALAAELIAARETLQEWKASQHYSYIGADGKTVKARDLEDEMITARAKLEAAVTADQLRKWIDAVGDWDVGGEEVMIDMQEALAAWEAAK